MQQSPNSTARTWREWLMAKRPGAGWWVFLLVGVSGFVVHMASRVTGQLDALLILASWAFVAVGFFVLLAGRGARRHGPEGWERRVRSRRGRIWGLVFYGATIVVGLALVAVLAR